MGFNVRHPTSRGHWRSSWLGASTRVALVGMDFIAAGGWFLVVGGGHAICD
jgi:hypothetical protein